MKNPFKLKPRAPECPYCGGEAILTDSWSVYPHAEQNYGKFWVCPDSCDAYVGTHSNSKIHAPLGRLANAELRDWKKRAHMAFDPMWKEEHPEYIGFSREQAYRWLTAQMGRSRQVHIGFCSVSECKQIVEICEQRG